MININITNNSSKIGKSNNTLLRSSQFNFNKNRNVIKKEKIQIDAKKKEDDEKEIKLEINNNKNLNNHNTRKSVDRYSHLNNNTKVKRTGYKLKSKGKIFNKK